MATRAMGPMAGFGWLKNAVNLGRSNPKAIFGGAALVLVAAVVVAIAAALLSGIVVAAAGPGVGSMLAATLVVLVPVMVVLGMLTVGYLRLIDAAESGRPARAADVFGGFGDLPTSLRAIGLMIVIAVLQNLLVVGLLMLFAGGVLEWYSQMMQSSMVGGDPSAAMMQLPAGIGLAYLLMALVGPVCFGVQSVAVGQVALRGRGMFAAIGDGFAGAFKNLLPLLVMLLTYVVGIIVLGIVAVVLVMVVGLLAKVAGAWLGIVIGLPLYLGFLLAMLVVGFGAMYHLWRDVCGGDDTAVVPVDALTA